MKVGANNDESGLDLVECVKRVIEVCTARPQSEMLLSKPPAQ